MKIIDLDKVNIPGRSQLLKWYEKNKRLMDEITIREDDDYDVIIKRKTKDSRRITSCPKR